MLLLGGKNYWEAFCPRLGTPVPLAMRQQREQSMTGVAGVFDNFQSLRLTPPGVEVLDGRQLSPSDVLGHTHYPLQCLAVRGRAIAVPGSDATVRSQDALDVAAVEPFEDLKLAVQRRSPSNLTEIERIWREEWEKLPKYRCAKLAVSYPIRPEAVIAAKGSSTKY